MMGRRYYGAGEGGGTMWNGRNIGREEGGGKNGKEGS